MKLIAHINADGQIQGLVATPEGKRSSVLVPPAGVNVCEIEDHGLKGDTVDLDELAKLVETHTVHFTPARGKLVRRRK
ncbi:MAG TPA: hypothetical protein VNM67_09575 [Thermoanaerobaculia bacterium]|jgi:hypothetical protein|nr:hypothetical protein [Thermoanaerobaculia bacterium]